MESFTADFRKMLNTYLMQAMQRSVDPLARSCWMDGVLMPPVELISKKHVNDTRRLETYVWALTDNGNIRFDLVVYFGKQSLRRYAKGTLLDDCLQPFDNPDAVRIDFENGVIEVRLL